MWRAGKHICIHCAVAMYIYKFLQCVYLVYEYIPYVLVDNIVVEFGSLDVCSVTYKPLKVMFQSVETPRMRKAHTHFQLVSGYFATERAVATYIVCLSYRYAF